MTGTSLLYPRTVRISRPGQQPAVGQQGYHDSLPVSETPVLPQMPASIQFDSYGSAPLYKSASDATGRGMWKIFLPGVTLGTIEDRDIATDDLGNRYQIASAAWTPLGYELHCEKEGERTGTP